jgi:ketosteroid isomerase-like protein
MSTVAKAGHAKGIAQEYFSAWKRGDFDRVRSLLADDATFRGPLASVNGAEKISWGLTYQRNS